MLVGVGVVVADGDGLKEMEESVIIFCGLLHPAIWLDNNKTITGNNSSLLIMLCGIDGLSQGCLYAGTGNWTFANYFWRINTTIHNRRR